MMAEIEPNTLIPAVTGILGAFVGSVATGIPILLAEWCKSRKELTQLKSSLVAEVAALVEIAEKREYLRGLQGFCDFLQGQPEGTTRNFLVRIPKHYSRIYQANADRIGIVDASTARKIVQFHQFVDAVIQDVVPGGTLYQGGRVNAFVQTTNILDRALQLGREISDDT